MCENYVENFGKLTNLMHGSMMSSSGMVYLNSSSSSADEIVSNGGLSGSSTLAIFGNYGWHTTGKQRSKT
jgi:hypothetical protein